MTILLISIGPKEPVDVSPEPGTFQSFVKIVRSENFTTNLLSRNYVMEEKDRFIEFLRAMGVEEYFLKPGTGEFNCPYPGYIPVHPAVLPLLKKQTRSDSIQYSRQLVDWMVKWIETAQTLGEPIIEFN